MSTFTGYNSIDGNQQQFQDTPLFGPPTFWVTDMFYNVLWLAFENSILKSNSELSPTIG